MEEARLVSARLVFEIIPRFLNLITDLRKQKGHMEVIDWARAVINAIVAKDVYGDFEKFYLLLNVRTISERKF